MLFFINCSENCKHQIDGKCSLDCMENTTVTDKQPCAYYKEKTDKTNL